MSVIKKLMLLLIVILVLSLANGASGYNSAAISNNAALSIVKSEDALVAIPDGQTVGIINKMTIINNTSEKLKISVPTVTKGNITIKGDDFIIDSGSPLNIPNYPLNVTAPQGTNDTVEIIIFAESLTGNLRAEIKSVLFVKNLTE